MRKLRLTAINQVIQLRIVSHVPSCVPLPKYAVQGLRYSLHHLYPAGLDGLKEQGCLAPSKKQRWKEQQLSKHKGTLQHSKKVLWVQGDQWWNQRLSKETKHKAGLTEELAAAPGSNM